MTLLARIFNLSNSDIQCKPKDWAPNTFSYFNALVLYDQHTTKCGKFYDILNIIVNVSQICFVSVVLLFTYS